MNVTADVIHALQRDLYQPPEWCFATEIKVPHDGGLRFLDGMAVNIFKSPFETHGFECKVSRSDWLNEVRKADKHEPGRGAVDRFWFVFGSLDLYRDNEVPPECGIIAWDGKEMVARRLAQRPAIGLAGEPLRYDRAGMAAFLNRCIRDPNHVPGFVDRCIKEAERKGYQKGLNAAKRRSPSVAGRKKYDPGRYNLDDGEPLNLP